MRIFLSASNQLVSPFKDARKIKGITEGLSRMATNHAQFGSVVNLSTFNQTPKGYSHEEVAKGYALCLLNRGFFFWDERDEYKFNKYSNNFGMHNLMHDLMLSIAGLKYKMATSDTNEFDESVRHLLFYLSYNTFGKAPPSLFKIKNLESLLLPLYDSPWAVSFPQVSVFLSDKMLISIGQCLRILRMSGLEIDKLPVSITQLVNLYFLDLSNCRNLKELPEDITVLY